jgi:glutamyl/glutaminyl-tRNA synthetase
VHTGKDAKSAAIYQIMKQSLLVFLALALRCFLLLRNTNAFSCGCSFPQSSRVLKRSTALCAINTQETTTKKDLLVRRADFLRSVAGTVLTFWGVPSISAANAATNDFQAGLDSLNKDAQKLKRDVTKETKKATKSIQKETKKATKTIQKEVKKVDKAVTKETKKATKELKKVEKTLTKETKKVIQKVDQKTKDVQLETKQLGSKLGVINDGAVKPPTTGIDTSKLKQCTDPKTKCLK